ncbi:hypothetical protein [Phycicoccus flavus]|uniref:Uncharacterized protein n=1 Tax=Phycicoccus flavus TaxID=2502783 RepID=A0A8T6R074_9MICO|nr:hypothetical protein [Phycicoccus flavus]NHA67072.1 hypothetical protein [Phycicoccus flavus]
MVGIVLLTAGCSGDGATEASGPGSGTATASSADPQPPGTSTASAVPPGDGGVPPGAGEDPAALATAVEDLLSAREAALRAGDRAAFAATVAAPDEPDGERQLRAFRAARALGATPLGHDAVAPVTDAAAVDVRVRYRVRGVDRADRTSTVRYAVTRTAAGWRVASERPTGADAAPAWLAMPGLVVRRSDHAVVAGTAGPGPLRASARTVDTVLPALSGHWSGTPRRTLVLVPRTAAEAEALRGSPAPGTGEVAATTDGPTDAAGRATGDRVVLDPAARGRLTPTGRDVVLAHELAHVAVRATVPGGPPTWLSEGYADHVGYARAGLPQRALAAPLLAAVRSGDAPTALPGAADLDPATSDVSLVYLASWQAAETVVGLRGEAGLRALVRACADRRGEQAAERTCTAALPRVLRVDRDGLTRRWQARLQRLAGTAG